MYKKHSSFYREVFIPSTWRETAKLVSDNSCWNFPESTDTKSYISKIKLLSGFRNKNCHWTKFWRQNHKLICFLFSFKMNVQLSTFKVHERSRKTKSPVPSNTNCLCLIERGAEPCLLWKLQVQRAANTTHPCWSLFHCQNLSIDLLQCLVLSQPKNNTGVMLQIWDLKQCKMNWLAKECYWLAQTARDEAQNALWQWRLV